MASADFLRLTVFDYAGLFLCISARPPEVRHKSFLFYPPNLPPGVTLIFRTLTPLAASSTQTAFLLGSCSSGQDFAIPFFSSHLAMRTLGFTMRLAMSTSATDFHRLDLCHTRHTRAGACSRRKVRIIADITAGASPSPTRRAVFRSICYPC